MNVPLPLPGWLTGRRARERWGGQRPRTRVTRAAGYAIHSVEFGSVDAEALLLLHGLSGSSRWWHRNVPDLAGRYRVLIPDLIGFGRSPARGRVPAPDATADVLAAWLDATGVERAHVVGHSMGGEIAIHLAARHPARVARLVLVDAAGIPRPRRPAELARLAMEVAPIWRWGDPRFLPTIAGDALTAGPRVILRAVANILRDDVRPLLARIEAPTLIVWGERDTLVPLEDAAALREAIPGARLAVLRGASHNPMVDRPADFDRLVLGFLGGADVGH